MSNLQYLYSQYHSHINSKIHKQYRRTKGPWLYQLKKESIGVIPRGPAYRKLIMIEKGV